MTKLAFHQFAELFPLIEGDDFSAIVEDIRENGVRDRITLLGSDILDGRNRYRALAHLTETGEVLGPGWGHRAGEALSIEELEPSFPWFKKFEPMLDGDPLKWVLSKNLQRRHMDEGQRAMVAAKLQTIQHGGDRRSDQAANLPLEKSGIGQKAAAQLLNVSPRSVRSARNVIRDGAAELQHAVEQGEVAVSTAEAIAELPKDEQAEIVAKGEREILEAAKEIRSRKRQVRFAQVTENLARISEANAPLPTGRKYPVIYADPATRYVSGFSDRSIENHYPTMTMEELLALPVSDLATPSAGLFIWSTVPHLRNTMALIEAYGFTYVSCLCWDKVDHGTGHWAFNQHELLLIATRGDFPCPVPGQQPRSLYREKKGEHSEKPAWFAEQIERIYPNLPKIELFTRNPRPGWAAWGNQSGEVPAEQPRQDEHLLSQFKQLEKPEAAPAPEEQSFLTKWTRVINETMPSPEPTFAPIDDVCCHRDDAEPLALPDDFRLGPQPPAPPVNAMPDIPAFLRRANPQSSQQAAT